MKRPDLDQAIKAIWDRNRGITEDRLRTLVELSERLSSGPVDAELRSRAQHEAHKIAGSAGSFGFQEISELARELELMLSAETGDLPAGDVASKVSRLRELIAGS